MTENEVKELKRIFKVANFVAYAILASLLLYAGMIEFVIRSGMLDKLVVDGVSVGSLKSLSYGAIIGSYAAAYFVKQRMMDPKKISTFIPIMQNLYMKTIIILVICEVPVMIGLIMFFFTGMRMDFYIYLLLTAIMMVMFFPKYAEWNELMERKLNS